jgi:hypothetical protein
MSSNPSTTTIKCKERRKEGREGGKGRREGGRGGRRRTSSVLTGKAVSQPMHKVF